MNGGECPRFFMKKGIPGVVGWEIFKENNHIEGICILDPLSDLSSPTLNRMKHGNFEDH